MRKLLTKKIENESEYFDILFIAGIIMTTTGLALMILFGNKAQSLTFIIVGLIISVISKIKLGKSKF